MKTLPLILIPSLLLTAVASADLTLEPKKAAIRSEFGGSKFRFSPKPLPRLANWKVADVYPVWAIEAAESTTVEIVVMQAFKGKEGSPYTVAISDATAEGVVQDSGNMRTPLAVNLGKVNIPAGVHEVKIKASKLVGSSVMDLHGIRLLGNTSGIKVLPPPAAPENPFTGLGKGEKLTKPHPSIRVQDLTPEGIDFTVGGMAFRPDGTLVLSVWNRTGSVYFIKGYESGKAEDLKISLFAQGLLEPLGVACVGKQIFVGQKHELTELIDHDDDGTCDEYRCVSDAWEVSGNFHLFTFGPAFHDGKLYMNLAVSVNPGGASTVGQPKDRGTCIAVDPETGKYEVIAAGLRTPNGLLISEKGEIFIADNQGGYLPANKIINVKPGRFYNHTYEPPHPWSVRPVSPPMVWLPQNEIANSPTQPVFFPESWGPYAGQLVFGDIHYGGLQRTFIDEVDGELQGAAFRFSGGMRGGVNRLQFGPDNHLYAGIAGRGGNWGDGELSGLERIEFRPDHVPFEILSMKAMNEGFELEFTKPLGQGQGWDVNGYRLDSWTYEPTFRYGGPKIDAHRLTVQSATVSEDRKRVFLEVPGMKTGYLVRLALHNAIVSETGAIAQAAEVFYTLNHIPTDRPSWKTAPPKDYVKLIVGEEKELPRHLVVYQNFCVSCHSTDGSPLVGPSFKGMLGRKQNVIREGKTEEVTVDREYIHRGIVQPGIEYSEGMQPIMPESLHEAFSEEDLEKVIDWISSLK